ncbi:MAG: 6-bladed beta-propeller [Acidobacteriota bacterium]|nr:6-bladed beta-propeller [Acidobacteriota bacterium]
MNQRKHRPASFIVLICLAAFLSCKNDRHTIHRENDHIVVDNKTQGQSAVPAGRVVFQDLFSIGKESGDENEMFFSVLLRVRTDKNGNIYVWDVSDRKLSKYDRSGTFLWRIGRSGQGPEDFEAVDDFSIGPDDRIYLLRQMNLKIYSTDGVFIDSIKLDRSMCSIDVVEDTGLFFNAWPAAERASFSSFFYSIEGNFLKEFPDSYEYGPPLGSGGPPTVKAFRHLGRHIYFSLPDKYEIREYDLQGQLLRIIRRNVSLDPFTITTQDGKITRISVRDRSGPCFLWNNEYIINILRLIRDEAFPRELYMDFFDKRGFYMGSEPIPPDMYLDHIDDEGRAFFVQQSPFPAILCKRLIIHDPDLP